MTLWAGLVSALAGTLEVATALMLGWVIDAALNSSGEGYFAENVILLLGVTAFFVVLRARSFLVFPASMQAVVVGPSLGNLILSRLHRHSLGQSVTFFDNDFAGRIAQKQMQAARATTDLTVEMIQRVAFALASLVGSVILLFTIDARSALSSGGLGAVLYLADPVLHAADPRTVQGAGGDAGDGDGAGGGYDHQHQNGQAFRP